MSEDIPAVFVIADNEGRERLTLTHEGEHLALRTFPDELGEPVLLDLGEADTLADMLAHSWPVIRIVEPDEDETP